jgi:hypothetical protein
MTGSQVEILRNAIEYIESLEDMLQGSGKMNKALATNLGTNSTATLASSHDYLVRQCNGVSASVNCVGRPSIHSSSSHIVYCLFTNTLRAERMSGRVSNYRRCVMFAKWVYEKYAVWETKTERRGECVQTEELYPCL